MDASEVIAQCRAVGAWRRKEIRAREANGVDIGRKIRVLVVGYVLTPKRDVPVGVAPANAGIEQTTIVYVYARNSACCTIGEVVIHEDVVCAHVEAAVCQR